MNWSVCQCWTLHSTHWPVHASYRNWRKLDLRDLRRKKWTMQQFWSSNSSSSNRNSSNNNRSTVYTMSVLIVWEMIHTWQTVAALADVQYWPAPTWSYIGTTIRGASVFLFFFVLFYLLFFFFLMFLYNAFVSLQWPEQPKKPAFTICYTLIYSSVVVHTTILIYTILHDNRLKYNHKCILLYTL